MSGPVNVSEPAPAHTGDGDLFDILPAQPQCPRHQCENCGRFVPQSTVLHGDGYNGIEYDYWATGECKTCARRVDLACLPFEGAP